VLSYLSRYTHRVAISNSRLISLDDAGVTFKWKDYRAEQRERQKIMTLATDEFIRRFLTTCCQKACTASAHYGLFAKSSCADNIVRARELLAVAKPEGETYQCRARAFEGCHAPAQMVQCRLAGIDSGTGRLAFRLCNSEQLTGAYDVVGRKSFWRTGRSGGCGCKPFGSTWVRKRRMNSSVASVMIFCRSRCSAR